MRRRTLIQLILAGILFAGVLGAYVAWYVSVSSKSATAAAIEAEIRTKSQDSARVLAAKEALASLVADEASVQGYLIRQQEIVPFLTSLEDTGTGLGSSVEVVSVAADPSGERSRIQLSLKITGTFDSVLRTLGSIEYGPYDSAITNVTFDTTNGAPEEAGVWNASATFTIGTRPAPTR